MSSSTLTSRNRAYLLDLDRLAALADYELLQDGTLSPVEDEETARHLTGLTRLAALLCGVTRAVLNVQDARHQHQVAAVGVTPRISSVEDSLGAVVLAERRLVAVPDASLDPRFRDSPFVDGREASIRLYASAPVTTRAGHVIAGLCVFDTEPRVLSEQQCEGLVLLAEQVTETLELRRRTRQLDTALAELHRSNALLEEFAGRVSHDLKTPLTSILGFAQLLQNATPVGQDEQASVFIDRIAGSGRRMRELIDDLLAYASVGGTITLEPVDVATVVGAVRRDLGDGGQRVNVHVRSDLPVQADPVQLRALVQNLVCNAVVHAPGSPVEVVAEAATPTGWTVRVIDHGPGVPEDERHRVLLPLVHSTGSDVRGSGLGLATCQRIATAHGGTLHLDGTPGGGTTATLHVP